MNISYKYNFIDTHGEQTVNREAADPSLVFWKGVFYLYPSMSGGLWTSKDLLNWTFHKTEGIKSEDYAPDVRIIGDYLYFCASKTEEDSPIYRTKDPINGPYDRVSSPFPFWDPNLFEDEDGKVYLYWGCSNNAPLYGIELDAKTFKPFGEQKELLWGDQANHGFERRGDNHVLPEPKTERERLILAYLGTDPYIEGAWMTKHDGVYYLQYAAPGSQYNVYADGVYLSKNPLGPFVYAENNPFSYKPGGFINGIGHGSTVQDGYGNWWHIATMRISIHHQFERRLGLLPAGFDDDGELFCNANYGDWPRRIAPEKMNPWEDPEWMLLSYGKVTNASSSVPNHGPSNAVDENIRTWWTASTNKLSEFLEVDLGKVFSIGAVQINFADGSIPFNLPEGEKLVDLEHMKRHIDLRSHHTAYLLEASQDGTTYITMEDKRGATTDLPHDFLTFENFPARYLRISEMTLPFSQAPSISGLRVFGRGKGSLPDKVTQVTSKTVSPVDEWIEWNEVSAQGYNVSWGHSENKLYHSNLILNRCNLELKALNASQTCYVRVDAFNENGITKGEVQRIR